VSILFCRLTLPGPNIIRQYERMVAEVVYCFPTYSRLSRPPVGLYARFPPFFLFVATLSPSDMHKDLHVETEWQDRGCMVSVRRRTWLAIPFIYTACFNFLLFLVAGWGFASSPTPGTGAHLVKILFSDGLIFYAIA
jgi:hypothetical protein